MQAIFESIFDICYLVFAISMGIFLIKKNTTHIVRLYGIMALILGLGDSFHLVPRVIALNTTGLESMAPYLGVGKLVTSITMTIFYLMLYKIYIYLYNDENKSITKAMYILTALRIALCLFPQNEWLVYEQPLNFAIYRNIPFAIIGIIMIILFQKKKDQIPVFKHMALAIFLSFAFYIPVVLFANTYPLVGMLMIPKTVAYAYIVYLGYKYYKTV